MQKNKSIENVLDILELIGKKFFQLGDFLSNRIESLSSQKTSSEKAKTPTNDPKP